jgi:hypothetical protein
MIEGMPKKIIAGAIGLVLVFVLMAAFYPVMVAAGDKLNESGIPNGEYFAAGGVIWTILGIMILVAAIILVVNFAKSK